MLFNTNAYLIFYIVVFCCYWILPDRLKKYFLLIASYYFYMQWNPYYIVLIVGVTFATYVCGLVIAKTDRISRKLVLSGCLILCLSILGVFKYWNFFLLYFNKLLSFSVGKTIDWTSRLILPVGISFYTLQALGYLIDVYRKDIEAEKNIVNYALFISFFPQLVAGPIERSKDLLGQLKNRNKFSCYNLQKGLVLMLWGLFVKMVIADRVAIFVDRTYEESYVYPGFFIIIATILFSIQIYCDFYGYSTIARGTALTLGIKLSDNFNAPYFSKTVKEFWRKWHISLSNWFRDYLYIPLGGNKKGRFRQMLNLLFVFAVSGLWHGASLGYVFWGFLNGGYQVVSSLMKPLQERGVRLKRITTTKIWGVLKQLVTFALVSFAWLFFRAGGLNEAKQVLLNIYPLNNWNVISHGNIFGMGIDKEHFIVVIIAILILMFVDYFKNKKYDVADVFLKQNMFIRIGIEMFFVFMIMVFGCYGEMYDVSNFIYFQF